MSILQNWRLLPGLLLLATACGRAPDRASTRDIVSLSPQASVALRDMGLEGRLAGVITDDPICPPGCTRLGPLGALDSESLLALAPTTLIAAAPGGMLPTDPIITRLNADPRVRMIRMKEPRSLEEALTEVESLAQALGNPPQAAACAKNTRTRLQTYLTRAHAGPKMRVLLLAGLTPEPGALGPGMLHGALLEAVGAQNALPKNAPNWLALDAEAIIKLDPDAILLLNPDRTDAASQRQLQAELEAAYGHLPIAAAKHHQLRLISDPLCMIPSTNLPHLAQLLDEAVHSKYENPGNAGLQAR